MSRLGSWLRGPAPKVAGLSPKDTLSAEDETDQLLDAMAGASLIMNDDMDGANAKLGAGNSIFHGLGSGITFFMKALLGWEQEVMKEAAALLNDVESRGWVEMKKAQKEDFGYRSSIYPAGTEYQLVIALAQLMGAVVGVLTESLTEAIRGFYKLRKAYIALDGIMAMEDQYLRQKNKVNEGSKSSLSFQTEKERMPGGFDTPNANSGPPTRNASSLKIADELTNQHAPANGGSKTPSDQASDLEFVDADEAHSGAQTPANYLGHVETTDSVEKKLEGISLGNGHQTPENDELNETIPPATPKQRITLDQGPDSDTFKHPIDVFIHTGTNLCLGILLLVLGMVPPAFNRLLYVVGFKGDRERGLQMLWLCTKFPTINGAMAGLILFGYYNGLLGFSDIVLTDADTKDENITGYPKAKCEGLLRDMRARYPKSRLWRLEEARMLSGNRQLRDALSVLNGTEGSPMKQISAITMFEKSMNSMYVHDYALCSESFMNCVGLNNWSHALYYFIAGAAQLELYRDLRLSNPDGAKVHKDKATDFLIKAPTHSGKKKFMAKQLPFDMFVIRKVQKWEERAKEWGVDLVDAIGVSPLEEMLYLWNGSKRMNPEELEITLANLEWNRATHPEKHTTNLDETALHALLTATILRCQEKFDEARNLLTTEILVHDK